MATYQAMSKAEENRMYFYFCEVNDHPPAETVSTKRYRWMCRLHVPVYLFDTAKNEELIKFHHGVSKKVFPPLFFSNKCITLWNKTRGKKLKKFSTSYLPQKEDPNHPEFVKIMCTGCGQAFDRSNTLKEIQTHELICASKITPFLRVCRFCGKVTPLLLIFFSLYHKFISNISSQSFLSQTENFHHFLLYSNTTSKPWCETWTRRRRNAKRENLQQNLLILVTGIWIILKKHKWLNHGPKHLEN